MKKKIRSAFVEFLTSTLGNLMVSLRPKKVRQLSEKGLTLVLGDNLSLTERLMRRAILKKIEKTEDYDKLAKLHQNYWAKQGDDFVAKTQNNLENIHLPGYKSILNVLENQISNEPINFEKLVEIGTGNGSVLNYLSSRFPQIENMVGIDLSEGQIAINKVNYKENPKLEFVAADVLDWVANQGKSNMVFLTFRGVFEYFSQKQLILFFEKLNSMGNIIFFTIEPNGVNHDFKTNPNSQIYGVEGSFSHNYIKLFEDTGFKVWHHEQKKEPNQLNFMSIVGAKNF